MIKCHTLYTGVYSDAMQFNLGFGHPAKDVCAKCVQLRLKMNNLDANDADRREAIMMYMLLRRRSRVFYNLLNDVEKSITICFDMMENMVLP